MMQSPLVAIQEYYRTFSTLDLPSIAQHFTEPCMSTSSQGVYTAATHEELTQAFQPLVDGLKAQGYSRSEFADPELLMLGPASALIRGIAVRYAKSGAVMARVRITYLMQDTEVGWRIAAMLLP